MLEYALFHQFYAKIRVFFIIFHKELFVLDPI